MKLNRKWLLIVSLVLSVAMATSATLAYLTDTKADVNVMTLGSVYIEQIEQEYDANGDLVDFTQNKPLYPYVGTFGWANTTEADGAYRTFTMENVVDKYVSVKNTGKSDAFVRTIIALEMGSYDEDTFDMVGLSINKANGSEYKFPGTWDWKTDLVAEIDGHNYYVMTAVHQDALKPGDTTIPSLNQVYLSKDAGNKEVENLDGNGNGMYDILVLSQAVQTAGFETAEAALEAAFGEVTETNLNDWFGNVTPVATVATAEDLTKAFTAGGTIVLTADIEMPANESLVVAEGKTVTLDLGGHTIKQENAPTTAHALINNKGTLTITGEGAISYADVNTYSKDNNFASNTIRNEGILNIEGGVIENVSSDNVRDFGYPHAIDVYQGSVTNITGGTVKSANYDSIRMFCNSTTEPTIVNISGGTIINRVSFQNPNNNTHTAGYGVLNISGGEFITTGKVNANVRLLNFSRDFSNMKATVTGGTFDKGFKTQDYANCGVQESDWLTINTTLELPEKVSDAAGLQDALTAGGNVLLTNDVNVGRIDLTSAVTDDVVIDASGYKITTTDSYGIQASAGKNITLANADVVMTKAGDYITYAAGFKIENGDYEGATITLQDCKITMANGDWAYAVNMPASVKNLNLVIDNCVLEGALALQCWGDGNTITIKNSELICNYTTNALYTSYCVALQDDGSYSADNNTLVIDNCKFSYSGIDNFNSEIKSVADLGNNNTVTVTNCTYGDKVVAY